MFFYFHFGFVAEVPEFERFKSW